MLYSTDAVKVAARILAWRLNGNHSGDLYCELYGSDLYECRDANVSPQEVASCLGHMVVAGDWDKVRKPTK